ncbi:hypothetical protein DS909_12445, partial [Phaeobacter gallaeciensis]
MANKKNTDLETDADAKQDVPETDVSDAENVVINEDRPDLQDDAQDAAESESPVDGDSEQGAAPSEAEAEA